MSDPSRPAKRVRVTRSTPFGAATGDAVNRTGSQTGGQTGGQTVSEAVSDVYDRQLRRTILLWAAGTVAVVAIPLFGLPLVLLAVPGLAGATVAGVPVPWLLLGLLVYPLVWLAGRWFVQGAESTERDYDEALRDRPPGDG